MMKHGLSSQQEQPQTHQLYQHHHQQQQEETLAAISGSLLQSTNATITHQLTVNPVDHRITDFSLYDNAVNDYSCITK